MSVAVKKDYVRSLRLAYVTKLRTLTHAAFDNVYYELLPVGNVPDGAYTLIKGIVGADETDKNSYDVRASVLLDITENFAGNSNYLNINAAADELVNAINEDNAIVMDDFICHLTTMVSSNILTGTTDNGSWAKRLIRFEHFLEQVN